MMTRFALISMLLFGASPASSQARSDRQPDVVIRTSTRLVEMTVIVQDAKGRPVTDLTKDDFTITENGKPQAISIFDFSTAEKIGTPATQLPAGFFSNRLEYSGGVRNNATAVLIDLVNTPPGYWGRARPHLARFLHQADPRLNIGIYILTRSGVRVLHDFTTDAALLTRKLGEAGESIPQGLSREMEAFLTSVGNPAGAGPAIFGSGDGFDLAAALIAASEAHERAFYEPQTSIHTADALAAIAQRLSGVPGRKNLVWLSTGFKVLSSGAAGRVSDAFDRAARALSNASVAVYPLDARGLLALTDDLRIIENRQGRRAPRQALRFETGPTEESNAMRELAARTGGHMFFGDEVDEALPQVLDHARAFYILGYYPSYPSWDGKFLQVHVRVRRKNVKVSHRSGYYALPEGVPHEDQLKAELVAAVWSPVDATAVPIEASLERRSGDAPDSRTLVLAVDGKALLFEPRGENVYCRLDLLVVQKNSEGKQIESTLDTFETAAAFEKAQVLQKRGLIHRKELRLKPETAILRVVVRNRAGALGSLSIPLRGS